MILFVAAATLLVIVGIALLLSPFWGVMSAFVAKPVIDATWRADVAGFSLLDIVGVVFLVTLLPRVLFSNALVGPPLRIRLLAYIYLASQTLGSYFLLSDGHLQLFVEIWARSLSGFLGFFLFSRFFCDSQRFKMLLMALIVAGIFPLLMGIYQNATGVIWQERMTVGLMRKVGLYHDAFSLRFFGLQSIASVVLYRSYVGFQKRTIDLVFVAYVFGWVYVIFNVFSKAAVLILVLWAVTWLILNRKFSHLIAVILLATVLSIPLGGPVLDTCKTVFSKELAIASGEEEDVRRAFAGRGFLWERAWQAYSEADVAVQTIGSGRMEGHHNEFLRVLRMNGVLGLCCLMAVLVYVTAKVADSALRRPSPLNIVAVMVLQMYLVDCMGLHPGWYPAYQWFVWGIIGLALCSTSPHTVDDTSSVPL